MHKPYTVVKVGGGIDPATALQKQVGCFNHRVVTLVADKLERQWLREVFFGVEV